jgi:hypothetical protein
MKTYAKKPLLLTIFVTLLVNFDFAQAATHIRLWRGFKQDSSTSAEFRFNVASKLVPATVVVGKDKGLVSYMPVFTNNLSSKPNFIPDEVAIIQYTDEAVYKTLAKTPEFSAYGKMHYDEGFFIKKNQEGFSSGSLVSTPLPQELNLNLEVDSALHYGKVDESWQNDSVDLSILLLKDNDKLACIQDQLFRLKRATEKETLKGFILSYSSRYILIYSRSQYLSFPSDQSFNDAYCLSKEVIPLQNSTGFSPIIDGLNFQF